MRRILLFVMLATGMSACLYNHVFEKNHAFTHQQWSANNKVGFVFKVEDTTCDYMVYATLRHTDAYPFSNIWLNVETVLPGTEKPIESKVELTLAQQDGKWLGRGMQDIREHQIPLTPNGSPVHFSKPGTYTMRLQHLMRREPLPDVMSVGIRLEKIIR